MLYNSTRDWVETLTLNVETQPLADLLLMLAQRYDDKGETSTAGEFRKTMNELRASLIVDEPDDPLETLLTR
jgi:hypothetical protein